MSKVKLACEVISGMALLAGIGAVALNWTALPNTIAVHFNYLGQPDGYGPKEVLFFMVGLAVVMQVTLSLGANNPKRANVPWKITEANREETMAMVKDLLITIKAEISVMLSYLLWAMVQCGLKQADGLGVYFLPIFLLATFAPIVAFFVRGRKFNESLEPEPKG